MGAKNRSASTTGEERRHPVPGWTWIEVLGLVVSAVLIAAPLLTLAFSFIAPPAAPAGPRWPTIGDPTPTTPSDTVPPTMTPTSGISPTATPPVTPTATPPVTPTATPPVTPTATPPVTPTSALPPTATPSPFSVEKVADKEVAQPGETVVFSIGLINRSGDQVTVNLNDTLPSQMSYSNGWHTCATGSSISPGGSGYSAVMVVPAGQSCQLVVSTVVNSGCNCYVQNSASWSGGGYSGTAHSQRIWLPAPSTQSPTDTPTTPITPPSESPTTPPTTAPTTPPIVPTTAASPTTPPIVPTAAATEPPAQPTPRTTERPPGPTAEPTAAPTPVCAQARISGNVCAAGVTVVISSCCPPWSAQTTTDSTGFFEFGSLTPGTFTVSALGRSRTVRLAGCDSTAWVNLCPVTAVPSTATPTMTVAPTLTATTVISPPGTQLPTEGYLLLETVDAEDNLFQPGENITLRATLHNGEKIRTWRGVVIGITVDDALELLGAASAKGEILLSGQRFLLTGATLGPTNDLVVLLDMAVRADTPSGTLIDLQGTARTDAGDMFSSNVLQIEVWGEGVAPLPAGGTPLGTVTPAGGGPEPQPTTAPSTSETDAPILPPTSTGVPIVGVMLGGGVLLARQLRLRKAGRHEAE